MPARAFVPDFLDPRHCAPVVWWDVASHSKNWQLPVTNTKVSTFGPRIRQSSTRYDLLGRQKRAIPPWCALGAFNLTTEYPLYFWV